MMTLMDQFITALIHPSMGSFFGSVNQVWKLRNKNYKKFLKFTFEIIYYNSQR